MKRLLCISLLFLLLTITALAHEFWFQPQFFRVKPGRQAIVNIMVGEDFAGEKITGRKYDTFRLHHYANGTQEDLKKLVMHGDLSAITIPLRQAGDHLLVFNNSNKFIELDGPKFNAYLRSEGLHDALQARITAGDTLRPGRELYQRCIKTLLRCGNTTDSTYKTISGMPLEIIPMQHPYQLSSQKSIGFTVLYNGKPLKNALVLGWHATGPKGAHTTQLTNANGEVHFNIEPAGRWMISTVHMVPHTDTSNADWQSYWASYTFGYY